MAVKFLVPKTDGTTYEVSGWDDEKTFLAVIIRKDTQRIRDYNWYKTFGGARGQCKRWGYGVDISDPSENNYVVIVKGEVE